MIHLQVLRCPPAGGGLFSLSPNSGRMGLLFPQSRWGTVLPSERIKVFPQSPRPTFRVLSPLFENGFMAALGKRGPWIRTADSAAVLRSDDEGYRLAEPFWSGGGCSALEL